MYTFPRIIAPLRLYTIVPNATWVARMIQAGVNTIQLRNKNLKSKELKQEITQCIALTRHSNNQFFVNDHWQYAIETGAYGVHLGQEDLETADLNAITQAGLRLGVSTHSFAEIDSVLAFNPSYIACGAIFPTQTKQLDSAPQGLAKLRDYVSQAQGIPIVAIGGITPDNAQSVLEAGASSIAVISAITQSINPEATVKAFQALWHEANHESTISPT